MIDHPYGWLSVLPPLVAIVTAVVTKRVISSLLFGVVVGAFLLASHGAAATPDGATQVVVDTVVGTFEGYLWPTLIEADHLRVFVFTLLMGAMIGVVHRSGGMHAVVDLLTPWARSRRGGQLVTWVLGLVVFIDDYANTLLLGNTMRPLTDRLRISREKLAYIVDSTAAPVAGLALVSTWVAGEIGYIEEGFAGLELEGGSVDGLAVFIETIPYRFYVLWALLFVPLTALLNRDFGPMLRAERRALKASESQAAMALSERADGPKRPYIWVCAVMPILLTIVVTVWLLYATGFASIAVDAERETGWRWLVQVFGNGESYMSLVYGSLSGLLAAAVLARWRRVLTVEEVRAAAMDGARLVLPALAILWLAWSLSKLTESGNLGTGEYLASLLRDSVHAAWMPTIVFLLASVVAFATGTSWGTMGILMPLVVRVTYQILALGGSVPDTHDPILVASIGGVLAGAIFGDHCSPISDTTVLSSQASACNHVAHVVTQFPYALVVALVSILFGTIPVGWGVSPWVMLPVGSCVLVAMLALIGRPAEEPSG